MRCGCRRVVFFVSRVWLTWVLFCEQGFGVTARSTAEARKLDPTGIVTFRQADVGEYLRDVGFLSFGIGRLALT